jgi:ABC-2 type transport system ATP-binding protein
VTVAASPVVETHGLTKVYQRGVRALDGLDLTVGAGELVGFLGPNGAGKTTAVQLLIGAIRATSGNANVLGRPAGEPAARRWLGYLPEQFQFPGFLTPLDLLDFHGRLLNLERRDRQARARELLRLVGLEDVVKRPMKTFSKGMLQRVGLAQALLGRPTLLLLDEPTSGLDPVGTRNVRDLLLWLREQGVAVLLNSHLLSEVELVCDRVAILNRGRIVAEGPIESIVQPSSAVRLRVRDLDDAGRLRLREVAPGMRSLEDGWWETQVAGPEDAARIADVIVGAGGRLDALVPVQETLEQAFLRLIGHGPSPAAGLTTAPGPAPALPPAPVPPPSAPIA